MSQYQGDGDALAEALRALADQAAAWARAYVALVEALSRAGVPESRARAEAREAANLAVWCALMPEEDDDADEDAGGEGGGRARCPLCGGEGWLSS